MSRVREVRPTAKPSSELRPVLNPAGSRAKVSRPLESLGKKEGPRAGRKMIGSLLDVSADGSCSSDSSGNRATVKEIGLQRRRRHSGVRSVKVVPEGADMAVLMRSSSSPGPVEKRRCAWITPYSDQVYVAFHDEEWGMPVHDDQKLFELLVLSEALAELRWPDILKMRDFFRKLFDKFDPLSVAEFTEKKIFSLKSDGKILLSVHKLQAVVENARQMRKVIKEFGSFSYYCWSFVNHKPIINGFRYARQVPVKTPKAEAISKDLMQRGFRCVGPTIIYSFMQASGMVNDHVSSCFRYQDCIHSHGDLRKQNAKEPLVLCKTLDKSCSLQN